MTATPVGPGRTAATERLVLSHFTLDRNHPLDDRIRAAGAAGFAGIGLFAGQYRQLLADGWSAGRLHDLLDEHGVSIMEVEVLSGWGASHPTDDYLDFERFVWEMVDEFDVAYVQAIGPVDVGSERELRRGGRSIRATLRPGRRARGHRRARIPAVHEHRRRRRRTRRRRGGRPSQRGSVRRHLAPRPWSERPRAHPADPDRADRRRADERRARRTGIVRLQGRLSAQSGAAGRGNVRRRRLRDHSARPRRRPAVGSRSLQRRRLGSTCRRLRRGVRERHATMCSNDASRPDDADEQPTKGNET